MGDTVDSISLLQVVDTGMAMFTIGRFTDSTGPELTWLLRLSTPQINSLPEDLHVQIRAGVLYEDQICLIPVQLCVDQKEPETQIFETWINVFQKGENPLTLLAVQPRIVIQLYGDSGRCERMVEIANPLQPLAKTTLVDLSAGRSWTLREFEQAREKLCRKYPTELELWKVL